MRVQVFNGPTNILQETTVPRRLRDRVLESVEALKSSMSDREAISIDIAGLHITGLFAIETVVDCHGETLVQFRALKAQ